MDSNVVVGRTGRGIVDADVGSFLGSSRRVLRFEGNGVLSDFRELIGEGFIDKVVLCERLPV